MKSKLIFATALFISVMTIRCSENDGHEMKFDLSMEVGKTYSCSFYHSNSTSFLQQSRSDTVDMQTDLKIEAGNDTANQIRIIFRRLHKSSSAPTYATMNRAFPSRMMKIDLDSKIDSVFRKTEGKEIVITVSANGIVQQVQGIDEVLTQIASELKEDKRLINSILGDYISDNAIKDNFNRIFSTVPKKEVKPGDNWGNEFTLVTKAPVQVNSVYTLKQLKGDSAYVDIQSKLLAGTPGKFYLNGTQSGLVILNHQSGLPYLFESFIKSTTNTDNYDVQENEHWLIVVKKL